MPLPPPPNPPGAPPAVVSPPPPFFGADPPLTPPIATVRRPTGAATATGKGGDECTADTARAVRATGGVTRADSRAARQRPSPPRFAGTERHIGLLRFLIDPRDSNSWDRIVPHMQCLVENSAE